MTTGPSETRDRGTEFEFVLERAELDEIHWRVNIATARQYQWE